MLVKTAADSPLTFLASLGLAAHLPKHYDVVMQANEPKHLCSRIS
jgi:hypothetical protein